MLSFITTVPNSENYRMKQSRNYVLTINNPEITLSELLDVFRRNGAIKAIAQLEKGENGTPHFQCFIGFKEARKFGGVKKAFPTAHIEPARDAYHAW